MRKMRTGVVLAAVIGIAVATQVPPGASSGTLERGWWAKPRQGLPTAEKAKVPPNPAAVAAKARLDGTSAKRWYVEWNELSGLPTGVSGESKQYPGTPTEIAGQFMRDYRPLFTGTARENDPGDVGFAFDTAWYDADPTLPATIVKYHEVFRGVSVHRGTVLVHINPAGRVIWAGGTPYRIDSLDVMPTLSPEGAVAAIRTMIRPDTVQVVAYSRLCVHPGPPARLVYDIWAEVWMDPFTDPFTFLVDAKSGEVLSVQMMSEDDPGPVVPPSKPKTLPDSLLKSLKIPPGSNVEFMGTLPIKVIRTDSASTPAPGRDSSALPPKPRPRQGRYEGDARMILAKAQTLRDHKALAINGGSSAQAWFFKASYSPGENRDGDSYDGLSYIDWDADTDADTLRIHIAIYGRDYYNRVSVLAISGSYVISGSGFDSKFVEVPVPYQGLWSFRMAICNEVGDTLRVLDYGQAPAFGPALPLLNAQEPKQEDKVYINTTYDPPGRVLANDWDGDGYYTAVDFLWKVLVEYDSTYNVYTQLIVSATQGSDYFLWYTEPYDLAANNNVILMTPIAPFPMMHNIWNVRADIVASSGLVLSSVQYGQASNWDTLHLERWNEDPRMTTVFLPNPIHRLNDATLWDMDDEDYAVPLAVRTWVRG